MIFIHNTQTTTKYYREFNLMHCCSQIIHLNSQVYSDTLRKIIARIYKFMEDVIKTYPLSAYEEGLLHCLVAG